MKWDLSIVALAVLAVAAVSRRLTRTSVTAPMAFMVVGLLVGPLVADEFILSPNSSAVRVLAEATLVVVLAPTDAALGQAVDSEPRLPARICQALNVGAG